MTTDAAEPLPDRVHLKIMARAPVRILIADDHEVVRQGLCRLLPVDPELEVVGEAANGREAVRRSLRLRPDVVVMDLLMPEMDGTTATHLIRRALPDTQVVILTNVLNDDSIVAAVRAGAIGYLLKETGAVELRQAIKLAASRQSQLSPKIATRLMRTVADPERHVLLSVHEVGVLRLIACGLTNKEIAGELFINERTVKSHVSNVFSKLGVRNRGQAAVHAVRIGLVPFSAVGPR